MIPPAEDPNWCQEVQALYRHDMQEIWDRRIAPHIWNQYHNQLQVYCSLVRFDKPLDILDVGCAQATLAMTLAEKGHRVVALDVRQHFLEYARSRYEKGEIEFLCGDIMTLDLDRNFDVIYANQIIEHLVNPLEFLRRLRERLKPGAILIVTTPNAEYLMNRLPRYSHIGELSAFAARANSADADGHFFAFTGEELSAIACKEQFNQVSVRFFESPFVSGHMKLRYVHSWMPGAVLRILDTLLISIPGLKRLLAHQVMMIARK